MNLETINKWLDEEYGCSYTKLEELHNFYFEKYCDLQQENKKLNGTIQTYDILLKSNIEENKQLQERMEYLERSNNRREDIIIEQRQEISDLEDNWDELKEYLEEWKENEEYCYLASSPIDRCRKDIYGEVLDKMQELQGSDSNE